MVRVVWGVWMVCVVRVLWVEKQKVTPKKEDVVKLDQLGW